MAHTLNNRQIQKIGRYSKELLTITFTSTSNTPASLDTRMSVPLFGRVLIPIDKNGAELYATVIITANQVTVSNRSGAFLDGQQVTVELTGY